jgi:adenylate cyclase
VTQQTVIGEAVNIASQLESANKQYGTDIIVGTRHLAGDRILVCELDRAAVYPRREGLRIFELIAIIGEDASRLDRVALDEAGIAAYPDLRGCHQFPSKADCRAVGRWRFLFYD